MIDEDVILFWTQIAAMRNLISRDPARSGWKRADLHANLCMIIPYRNQLQKHFNDLFSIALRNLLRGAIEQFLEDATASPLGRWSDVSCWGKESQRCPDETWLVAVDARRYYAAWELIKKVPIPLDDGQRRS